MDMNWFNFKNYKKTKRVIFLTGLSCLISLPVFAEESLTILYTGSVLGEIKPCGCSEEGDLGGILRRATIIENERKANKNLLLLDAGDSFKEPNEQGKLKAKSLIESMTKMKYDAAVIGEQDLIYGEEIINQGSFDRWVFSNVEHKNFNPEKILKYYIKKIGEHTKIAVIGLLGKDLFYLKGQAGFRIKNPFMELKKTIKEIKTGDKVDIILLLTHMTKEEAKELFNHKDVDIIINGHLNENERIIAPEIKDNRIMVHARERGQYLGKITLTVNSQRIQNISNVYIPLIPAISDSQLVQTIYDKYNEDAKQLFLNWLKEKKRTKNSPFLSDNACEECHEKAYAVWAKSDHAHAFNSIKKASKTFDPECLLCHTTGFKEEGGFLAENITPNLADVQCEVCHGSGRNHIADNSKPYGGASKEVCMTCHTRENSPGFNFSIYWAKIKH